MQSNEVLVPSRRRGGPTEGGGCAESPSVAIITPASTGKVPASRQVSDKWFVRVDGEKEFLRQKCLDMAKSSENATIHAVFHTGSKKENPHIHYILSRDKAIQKQAFDNSVKKLFGVAGTQYSTKPWDGEYKGAGSYLYHEEDEETPADVFVSKGITEIHVTTMREHAKEWRATVQEKKAKASVTLVQKAIAHFNVSDGTRVSLERIWVFMMDKVRAGENYFPGENIMRKYAIEVLIAIGDKSYWDQYVQDSFARAFPTRWIPN